MKHVCLYSEGVTHEIFNLDNPVVNRDNCMYSAVVLQKEFLKHGCKLATYDKLPKEDADIVLYQEIPKHLPADADYSKSYLIIWESELIRPDNWNLSNHKKFHKIFTWNDNFIDCRKYFKINFSHGIPDAVPIVPLRERKLCTLIAGNKSSWHTLELYSKRRDAIRWFEENYPNEFDLYGAGWKNNAILKKLERFRKLQEIIHFSNHLIGNYPSYCGKITSKNEILKRYKFCICYENARDIPGYITEKIFDCFFAGCVPIYWGADNIRDHIPENTFIDKTKFSSYDDLYQYIKNMPESEYLQYYQNIVNYLRSDAVIPFTADFFARTIVDQILADQ